MQLSSSQTAPSTLAGSPSLVAVTRALHPNETALLLRMLEQYPSLQACLAGTRVVEMQDGGMGSLRFVADHPQKLGSVIVEAQAVDADGVPLEISINLDEGGCLFELDIWKVDYTPLLRFPNAEDLTVAR